MSILKSISPFIFQKFVEVQRLQVLSGAIKMFFIRSKIIQSFQIPEQLEKYVFFSLRQKRCFYPKHSFKPEKRA